MKATDVDYVFNNVGFSSASTLYALPLREDVRERAEQTMTERTAAQPQAGREWGFYVIADLKTWATNAEQQSPIEHFATCLLYTSGPALHENRENLRRDGAFSRYRREIRQLSH